MELLPQHRGSHVQDSPNACTERGRAQTLSLRHRHILWPQPSSTRGAVGCRAGLCSPLPVCCALSLQPQCQSPPEAVAVPNLPHRPQQGLCHQPQEVQEQSDKNCFFTDRTQTGIELFQNCSRVLLAFLGDGLLQKTDPCPLDCFSSKKMDTTTGLTSFSFSLLPQSQL